MDLISALNNRFRVAPFIVNSMPKAGTHLLRKAVGLLPGVRYAHLRLDRQTAGRFTGPTPPAVPIGVDAPVRVSREGLSQALRRLRRGQFAQAHARYSKELAGLLAELGIKTVLILRDPRDVVVSHADFVARTETHFLYGVYRALSEPERLMASIRGLDLPDDHRLLSVRERYKSLMGWLADPLNYTTTFEKLVGPAGGGSLRAQMAELENITRHLGIRAAPRLLERVAQRTFGGTYTFSKGTIGRWRERFTEEHKQAMKEIAGQLLIDLEYEQGYDW